MKRALTAIACGAAFLLLAGTALAQSTLLEEVSQVQIDGALSDLSEVYGFPVVRIDQAKAICNEEQYIADCAEIGKQHDLFSEDRTVQVDAVLAELKGSTIDQLKQCADVACLVEVASSIAGKLNKKHPDIARAVELTPQKVGEKRDIVEAAASLGVDIEACRTMDPDTATIELLRGCARLAKHENVQKYIPEEARARGEMSDQSLALRESLTAGEFQCGTGTLESCGNFCLNPSAEARSVGASAIPTVCRQLAERFFGPEGVTELEAAYSNVQDTYNTFTRRAQNTAFTTLDGRTLTDMNEIGQYLENEGRLGNVEAVSAGMDFLVANGFVNADDRSFAISMVSRIRDRGPVDFNQCSANQESCADIVPEADRSQFSAMGEIEQIMRAEMTSRGISDPSRCATDSSMGEACMAAARAALPRMDAIAGRSVQMNALVENIRQQVRFGEEGIEARKRAEEHFRTGGDMSIGEKQFRSINDLEVFCRTNSQECLAETARAGFVSRAVATDRYEYSAERYHTPYSTNSAQPSSYSQIDKAALRAQFEAWLENPNQNQPTPYPMPQPYPYPRDPGAGSLCPFVQTPSPCPAGEYRQESRNEFGCFVSSACIPFNTETERPRDDGHYVCPTLPTVNSCPSGQEKIVSFSSPECGTYYSCRDVRQAQPGMLFPQTLSNGRVVYNIDEARAYCLQYGPGTGSGIRTECESKFGVVYSVTQPSQGTDCNRHGTGWHPVDESGNCFNSGRSEYRTPGGTLQFCSNAPVYGCSNSNTQPVGQKQQVWNTYGLQSSIRNDADITRIESLKVACAAVRSSSSSNIWMPNAGNSSSVDFGMPDPAKCRAATLCTTEQYFDGATCVAGASRPTCGPNEFWSGTACRTGGTATTTTSCPSGQSWNGTSCVPGTSVYPGDASSCPGFAYSKWDAQGARYCQLNTTTVSCQFFYPAYLTESNYAPSNCPSGTSSTNTVSGSCSTTLIGLLGNDCHSMGNAWFNGPMTRYVLPGGSTVGECTAASISGCSSGTNTSNACPSGQYWNGSACSTSTGSCPSGQYVNGACAYPGGGTGTYEGPSSSPLCSDNIDNDTDGLIDAADSGCQSSSTSCTGSQYWNGSACVNSTSTSCPSGQYWSGSACVNSTGGGTTDCSVYGSGWHTMDSSGNCFDSGMQNYKTTNGTLYSCTSTPVFGCSTSSSTSCPSGQYWNGSSCVTTSSTTCPSGQYWNGSSCVTTSTTDTTSAQSGCASAGGTWNSSSSYCQMPSSPSTSCSSGQYWNGSACVSSASTSCTGTQYWNGSACVDPPAYTPPPSSSCPSGQYWNGSACVTSPTSYFCPTDHDWNGSYCTTVAKSSTSESYTASVLHAFWSLLGL